MTMTCLPLSSSAQRNGETTRNVSDCSVEPVILDEEKALGMYRDKTKSTFCYHIAQLVRDEIQEVNYYHVTFCRHLILTVFLFLQAKESTEKY